MSLMTPENVARLTEIAAREWGAAAELWAGRQRVVLYDELRRVLTRAVCAWSGVPLTDDEVDRRTRQSTALFEHAGSIGPQHWRARLEPRRAEAWAAGLVRRVPAGELDPAGDCAMRAVADHRDADGRVLDERVAVELLNVLRPTVAVAVFITFAALALAEHAGARARLAAREAGYGREVRTGGPPFLPVLPVHRGPRAAYLRMARLRVSRWAGHPRSARHQPRPPRVEIAEGIRPRSLRSTGRVAVQLDPAGAGRPLRQPPVPGANGSPSRLWSTPPPSW